MAFDDDDDDFEDEGAVSPYVHALGDDSAARLFLVLGGSQVYVPQRVPRANGSRSLMAKVLGADGVERLSKALGWGYIKIPLGRAWLIGFLHSQGVSGNVIASMVRADVATVRAHLRKARPPKAANPSPEWQNARQWRIDLLSMPAGDNDNEAAST